MPKHVAVVLDGPGEVVTATVSTLIAAGIVLLLRRADVTGRAVGAVIGALAAGRLRSANRSRPPRAAEISSRWNEIVGWLPSVLAVACGLGAAPGACPGVALAM